MNPLQTAIGCISEKSRDFFQDMNDDFNLSTNFSNSTVSNETRRSAIVRLGLKVVVVAVIGSVVFSVLKTAILITTLAAVTLVGHDLAQISNNQRKRFYRLRLETLRILAVRRGLDPKEADYEARAKALTQNTCFPFMLNLTKLFLKTVDAYSTRNNTNEAANPAPARARTPATQPSNGASAPRSANITAGTAAPVIPTSANINSVNVESSVPSIAPSIPVSTNVTVSTTPPITLNPTPVNAIDVKNTKNPPPAVSPV